ncbi:NAD-dependent protein deacetylase [Paraburkholderia acidipaludis]|uniref:NAD-dependent protein deacetylase n=1 Tax=Paraburkholderia acidipaludis TaxID=660537 RepID=UPI00047F0D8F|nr:NAD-dependent protein deacetylase [Paraburkholderia acidipaludis]
MTESVLPEPAPPEFVPLKAPALDAAALDALQAYVERHPRLFVLTGAGISTDSGIPGYRDENGAWKRSPPITLQEFLGSQAWRRRYWARSLLGWPTVGLAQPNGAHRALARLETAGYVRALVTQNVDGLHQRAGSRDVVELHGSIGHVHCLDCGARYTRASIQPLLEANNPEVAALIAQPAADGDAHLDFDGNLPFAVPACAACGGMLKPSVVFFGENVPRERERVAQASAALDEADAVLVVGSSLMVFSGYRFCAWAQQRGKPVAAVNLGRTRADPLLALKVEAPCAAALEALVERLGIDPQ